MLNLGELHLMA